ncbi:matrixin family metalloprotease [Nitrosopumilus sp. S6]
MNIVFLGILSVLILFPISVSYGSEWNYLMSWNVDSINVVIESDFDVDDSKIDVIKSVIDSPTQHDGGFFGWNNAISFISEKTNTEIPQLHIVDEKVESDVMIFLTQNSGPDNTSGFTKYKTNNDSIEHVFVILYDIDSMEQNELEMVARHELGHAIGLGHTTNPFDMMFPVIDEQFSMISMFDLDALSQIYLKNSNYFKME